MEEKELLLKLRNCWVTTSVKKHVQGFWELDPQSFDFQELKLEKDALNLTSYYQSPQKEVGLIKLATFSLSIT